MADDTFTPDDPTASLIAFQSLTGKVHLLGAEEWGDNPACTSAFTRGDRVTVTRGDVTCEKCQSTLTTTRSVEVSDVAPADPKPEETDG